ncbi:Pentatricopeptide repeat superfamily protein [Perilla frutescens var. hirtella]|uniref:Pentatricopeptide repeat superfamily protein n=1 Tax=Perilla frutescens var. hirtella TaxID=608512 RepID=A0AAD4IML6_PERFH|nr:Pentatricopeptide repeat superfamily protein [Perilla frutescens var. hirtella]
MYGKCRQLEDALMVFANMIENDMYLWNSIISVHEQCGDHDGTLKLLKGMLSSGLRPDMVTFTAALPACSHLSALVRGKEIHGYMHLLGNVDLVGVADERVLELEPDHCGSYVLMSNVFGAAGRYAEVAELMHMMRQKHLMVFLDF